MNCVDDLTDLDLNSLEPGLIQSNSSHHSNSNTVSLFPFILLNQSFGLNLASNSHLNQVLRPLDTKDLVDSSNQEDESSHHLLETSSTPSVNYIESQLGDDELILHIKFSELVKIKSILIGTGGGFHSNSPQSVKVWINQPNGINFDETTTVSVDQEWELLQGDSNGTSGKGSVSYPVRASRFNNVQSIDLFFVSLFSPPSLFSSTSH